MLYHSSLPTIIMFEKLTRFYLSSCFFLHLFIGNMPIIIIYLIQICYIIDAFIINISTFLNCRVRLATIII